MQWERNSHGSMNIRFEGVLTTADGAINRRPAEWMRTYERFLREARVHGLRRNRLRPRVASRLPRRSATTSAATGAAEYSLTDICCMAGARGGHADGQSAAGGRARLYRRAELLKEINARLSFLLNRGARLPDLGSGCEERHCPEARRSDPLGPQLGSGYRAIDATCSMSHRSACASTAIAG